MTINGIKSLKQIKGELAALSQELLLSATELQCGFRHLKQAKKELKKEKQRLYDEQTINALEVNGEIDLSEVETYFKNANSSALTLHQSQIESTIIDFAAFSFAVNKRITMESLADYLKMQ